MPDATGHARPLQCQETSRLGPKGPSSWRVTRLPFPPGLVRPPRGTGDPRQHPPLPPGRRDPLTDRHPPNLPAALRKPAAEAVLTARLLPAPLTRPIAPNRAYLVCPRTPTSPSASAKTLSPWSHGVSFIAKSAPAPGSTSVWLPRNLPEPGRSSLLNRSRQWRPRRVRPDAPFKPVTSHGDRAPHRVHAQTRRPHHAITKSQIKTAK